MDSPQDEATNRINERKANEMREKIKAVRYAMPYHKFNEKNYNQRTWTDAVWELYDIKNMFGRGIIKLDILMAGKNEQGFYENYIEMYVEKKEEAFWDDRLASLGYGYDKDDATVLKIVPNWETITDDITEVIAEFDY